MRFVLAGVPNVLASDVRSHGDDLERPSCASDALRMLQRPPAPRLLVVSETFPGAGDVLAAVESDCRLATLVLVVVVGDRTALALALRQRGVAVVRRREAGRSVSGLLQRPRTTPEQARDRLVETSRGCTEMARRNIRNSQRLMRQSQRLCVLSEGVRILPEERTLAARPLNAEP